MIINATLTILQYNTRDCATILYTNIHIHYSHNINQYKKLITKLLLIQFRYSLRAEFNGNWYLV